AIEVGSASDDEEEEEEEENAEVAGDLYEAQTLMAISQSRSEARRRDHASPQRQSAGGYGGSPGGSDGSSSDMGSGDQGDGNNPTDIDPWIESRLANQTLIAMSVNCLFPILPFRPYWIFPHRPTIYTSLTAPAFCGHLITEANVKPLQAAEPWRVIQNALLDH
ncbi:Hypothetical protein PHPALM_6809, partial [Phytophthora palmivora]